MANAQIRPDLYVPNGNGQSSMKVDNLGNVHIVWVDSGPVYYK
jgi:hypothetical protein